MSVYIMFVCLTACMHVCLCICLSLSLLCVSVHRRTGRGTGRQLQRVDIIRAKHNTCLNNTNLGSVTGVNGNNSGTNISATTPSPPPQNMDPGKYLLLPPPTESIRAKLGLPPQMDVGPHAYVSVVFHVSLSVCPTVSLSFSMYFFSLQLVSLSLSLSHYRY